MAALTDRRNLVVCLFAGIGVSAVGPVLEATTAPYGLVAEGLSSHRTLAMGIAAGVMRAVAAVAGGWLGYQLDRIASDDSRRDEERRTNR